jgi:hypothetical protein
VVGLRFKKLMKISGLLFIVTLASAVVFCVGCSIHEHNRWGQPQDLLTNLLALGAYFSGITMACAAAGFIVGLVGTLSKVKPR